MPKDPVMLLSYVNTHLRDNHKSLKDFCKSFQVDEKTIIDAIATIDYTYAAERNQFVPI